MNKNCVQIENAETTTSFEPTIFEFTSCHSTPVWPLVSVSGANVRWRQSEIPLKKLGSIEGKKSQHMTYYNIQLGVKRYSSHWILTISRRGWTESRWGWKAIRSSWTVSRRVWTSWKRDPVMNYSPGLLIPVAMSMIYKRREKMLWSCHFFNIEAIWTLLIPKL